MFRKSHVPYVVVLAVALLAVGGAHAQSTTGRIIGTVTDAFYLRPHIQVRIFDFGSSRLRASLAGMFAMAHQETSAPGLERPLGIQIAKERCILRCGREVGEVDTGCSFSHPPLDVVDSYDGHRDS